MMLKKAKGLDLLKGRCYSSPVVQCCLKTSCLISHVHVSTREYTVLPCFCKHKYMQQQPLFKEPCVVSKIKTALLEEMLRFSSAVLLELQTWASSSNHRNAMIYSSQSQEHVLLCKCTIIYMKSSGTVWRDTVILLYLHQPQSLNGTFEAYNILVVYET